MTRLRKNILWPVAVCLLGGFGIVTSFQIFTPRTAVQAQEPIAARQAAEKDPVTKPNLSLSVPDEELRVWDPVNPNVNPVP